MFWLFSRCCDLCPPFDVFDDSDCSADGVTYPYHLTCLMIQIVQQMLWPMPTPGPVWCFRLFSRCCDLCPPLDLYNFSDCSADVVNYAHPLTCLMFQIVQQMLWPMPTPSMIWTCLMLLAYSQRRWVVLTPLVPGHNWRKLKFLRYFCLPFRILKSIFKENHIYKNIC